MTLHEAMTCPLAELQAEIDEIAAGWPEVETGRKARMCVGAH